MAYLDKNAILTSLTEEDIIKICIELGNGEFKRDGNALCFSTCLCHGGDSPYKLYYYPPEDSGKYGSFHCYTCQDSYNAIELVIRANRVQGRTITWFKALSWIASITGRLNMVVENPVSKSDITTDWSWIRRLSKSSTVCGQLPEYNETVLDLFTYYPYQPWMDEGISAETLSEFEIGYYPLKDCVTIPHRDIDGRFIGLRSRNLDPYIIAEAGKYIPMSIEGNCMRHQLGQNLYGVHINKDRIKECRKAMLVEGEKSVMQTNSYFTDKSFALGVCGSNISSYQIQMLLKDLEVDEVIVAFDREYEEPDSLQAEIYKRKLLKQVAPLVPYCKVTLLLDDGNDLEYKDSPTDKGKDVLLKLLDNKIEITSKDLEVLNEEVKI